MHIEHFAAVGLFVDGFAGLFLGTHEKNRLAVGHDVGDEIVCAFEHAYGLLQIEDVDTVAGAENVLFHLRVPPFGLMAEVDARFQQLFHCHICHISSPFGLACAQFIPGADLMLSTRRRVQERVS